MEIEKPTTDLLPNVILNTFSNYPAQTDESARCDLMRKQWGVLLNYESLREGIRPANTFGAKEWVEHFGMYVGAEPPIPQEMHRALKQPCPFSSDGKTVEETHTITLIPNGLTLKILGEIVKAKCPKMGEESGYKFILSDLLTLGNSGKPYWMLMPKMILKGSRKMNFADQQRLVDLMGSGKYHAPSAIEAAASLLAEHARLGLCLFDEEQLTYTHCQDSYLGRQVIVGGFTPAGLCVNYHSYESSAAIGIAPVRRF